jgi:hypothetical protein
VQAANGSSPYLFTHTKKNSSLNAKKVILVGCDHAMHIKYQKTQDVGI